MRNSIPTYINAAMSYPPFPSDVPTVGLTVVDYALLKNRDSTEVERLWDAATKQGFW